MKHHRIILACLAVAFVPFAAAAPKQSAQNEKILKATDPFEGLTESAIDGNADKIAKAFKAAEESRASTRALLPPDTAQRFDTLFAGLASTQAKKDTVAVALQAAELYKLLVSSCDASSLVVPMEVNLLDYSGFRTNALLKSTTLDWQALADTARDANGYWAKIRSRVTDKKLQAGMDKAQEGLATAAAKHNAALSHSSAKRNLDLVDELEGHFAKK